MARTIEIVVGDSFAERHEQLREQLGDEYEITMRENVEDVLHSLTKQLERSAEQQSQLSQTTESELDAEMDVSETVESSD